MKKIRKKDLTIIYGTISFVFAFIAMILIASFTSSRGYESYSVMQAGWAFLFLTIFTIIAWILHYQIFYSNRNKPIDRDSIKG